MEGDKVAPSSALRASTPDADSGSRQQQRRTCTACKASKVKCDRAAPTCGRCARLKLTCVQQPRSQGRPTKYSESAEPVATDRALTTGTSKPPRASIIEQSTQWAADQMAITFSNLLKAGAVHRYKTFAVLRVWMLFSLYYGVDLTRGFLGVALALLNASIQDLQRLPEVLLDTPALQLTAEPSQVAALDPSVLQPFIQSLDDGVSAVICCVGCRGGSGKIICNDKFRTTFFSADDVTFRTLNESTLPVFIYACIISPEDRSEFVDSLTNMCFGTQTGAPQVTHIVKVIDKQGNEFLAIVRLRCLTLNNGDYGADILTIEPAPSSKYVLQSTEGAATAGPSAPPSLPVSDSSSAAGGSQSGGPSTRSQGDSALHSWDTERAGPSGPQPPPVSTLMPPASSSGSGKQPMRRSRGGSSGSAGTPPQAPQAPPTPQHQPSEPQQPQPRQPASQPPPPPQQQQQPTPPQGPMGVSPQMQGAGNPPGDMSSGWTTYAPRYPSHYGAQMPGSMGARGGGGGGMGMGARGPMDLLAPQQQQGYPPGPPGMYDDQVAEPPRGRLKRPLPEDLMSSQPGLPAPHARMAHREPGGGVMPPGPGMRPGSMMRENMGLQSAIPTSATPPLTSVGPPYSRGGYYHHQQGGMAVGPPQSRPSYMAGPGSGYDPRSMGGPRMSPQDAMDGMGQRGMMGMGGGGPPRHWGMGGGPPGMGMGQHPQQQQPPQYLSPYQDNYDTQLSWMLGAQRDGGMGQGDGPGRHMGPQDHTRGPHRGQE